MSKFTDKQRSVIARKLGYDGPMQGFDDFLRSSPELAAKYSSVTDEYIKRFNSGGLVKHRKGYAAGGMVEQNVGIAQDMPPPDERMMFAGGTQGFNFRGGEVDSYVPGGNIPKGQPGPVDPELMRGDYTTDMGMTRQPINIEAPYRPNIRNDIDQSVDGSTVNKGAVTATPTGTNLDTARYGSFTDVGGKPIVGSAPSVTAEQIATSAGQFLSTSGIPALNAAQVAPFTPLNAAQAGGASAGNAATMNSAQGTPALQQQLNGVNAAQGGVGQNAMVNAQQGQLSKGAFAGAATGSATMATAANRTQQAGEMIDGSSVNQSRVDDVLRQNKAEQGVVTDEMTTSGQLNKMMAQFDAGNPPPWAAGAMRAANAQMAARGIGASSMAGQAIIQAAMEAATPIANADAKVFETMGLTNLSNRQQTALLASQQRAQFLGQEFDQNFQTKVLNAAKIADIANMNFNAQQQVALENSRAANSMTIANMSNQQAAILANAATVANMDMANLNNRQQAAVINAQSFLQMDMQNLQGSQQMQLFKAQSLSQSLLSDTAAENAARQFNASSVNQSNQFNAQLATQVSQFNASQQNAMSQFNTGEANTISKFNAEVQNRRDEFNSSQRLVIDQANAQWMKEISTQNTASKNAANYLNAQHLQQMTMAEYNNEVQLYRDQIDYAFKSYESDAERMAALARTELTIQGQVDAAKEAAKGAAWAQAGEWFSKTGSGGGDFGWLGSLIGKGGEAFGDWIGGMLVSDFG
jgi:hypothetical protein